MISGLDKVQVTACVAPPAQQLLPDLHELELCGPWRWNQARAAHAEAWWLNWWCDSGRITLSRCRAVLYWYTCPACSSSTSRGWSCGWSRVLYSTGRLHFCSMWMDSHQRTAPGPTGSLSSSNASWPMKTVTDVPAGAVRYSFRLPCTRTVLMYCLNGQAWRSGPLTSVFRSC